MGSGEETHVTCQQRPRANGDIAGVDYASAEVDEDVVAEDEVRAVVHVDRGADPWIFGEESFVFFLGGG